MTPAVRRASLLLAFSLLTSAATAYADAWIAWVHKMFQSKGIDEWTLAGAAESLDACTKNAVTAASNSVRKFREREKGGTVYTQTGMVIEMTYTSGEKASLVFVCLPDTVDPRGPKK